MKRSALPLVRGVYGLVRQCSMPRRAHATRKSSVAAAVVGEDLLDPHSSAQVAARDLLERQKWALAALIAVDRDGRQPTVVVNGNVAVVASQPGA